MTRHLTAAALIAFATISAGFAPANVQAVEATDANVTVIYKTNPHWPVRGLMTADPCAVRQCSSI